MDFLFSSKSKIMKNDDLTREDIKRIIDNLYSTIGVRMRVDMDDFHKVNYSDHVSQDSFPDIVEVFTNHLELPVKIVPVYNTAAKSNRFGTQDKPNKNVIRTWATTQEKSIQRISRPK